MKREYPDDFEITPDTGIRLSPKLIAGFFGSVLTSTVSLAIYGTVLYTDLKADIKDARNEAKAAATAAEITRVGCIDRSQGQQWVSRQWELNRLNNPSIIWGDIPDKH